MAGVRKNPNPGGNYQGWFTDAAGKRQFFTGTSDKKDTLSVARGLEDKHRQIRLGYRDAPTSAQRNKTREFDEVVTEYLTWGESKGGWRGRPWSGGHAGHRRANLIWWKGSLGLETLADLEGVLPRVEKALRGLESEGKSGKTQSNYAEALRAFCNYSVDRGYLEKDPLKALAPFDTTWSMNAVATAWAVFPTIGTAIRNLLYKSILVRQYVSLWGPGGKGPMRSTQFISPT